MKRADGMGDHAVAARLCLLDADQSHDITPIGVEVQFGVGVVTTPVGAAVGSPIITDMRDELTFLALRSRNAQMQAQAPIHDLDCLEIQRIHRDTFEQGNATALTDFLSRPGHQLQC